MIGYRMSRLAAALGLAVVATGCASTGHEMDLDEFAHRGSEQVTVVVQNNNWQDATVYLVGSGPQIRLGTVTSMNTERFTVPRAFQSRGMVRLVVDLIGSKSRRSTDEILVNPGDELNWVLENHLALSSYRVR